MLNKANLHYEGAFAVPNLYPHSGYDYGGHAICYNPRNHSLYLAGHTHHQLTGELAIPELGQEAQVLQPLKDAWEGTRGSLGSNVHIGGHLVYNNRLFLSGLCLL